MGSLGSIWTFYYLKYNYLTGLLLMFSLMQSYVCTACQGSSGLLLPLDPEINPRHHHFLQAMERRQFGRLRRRNGGRGPPDAMVTGLQVVKNGLVFFGLFKVLSALMK